MNSALIGIVVLYLLVLYIGKRVPDPRIGNYVVVGFITLLQVIIVLYFMYTMEVPPTK